MKYPTRYAPGFEMQEATCGGWVSWDEWDEVAQENRKLKEKLDWLKSVGVVVDGKPEEKKRTRVHNAYKCNDEDSACQCCVNARQIAKDHQHLG